MKKNYDYGDIEYKDIRDIRNLFNLPVDEDYEKPLKNNDAFKINYIEYGSKGDKDKLLSIKEYLNMIKPYLSNIINDHKTQGKWKVHSGNTETNYNARGEWEIQLTMVMKFNEINTMRSKSNNIENMMSNKSDEIIKKIFVSRLQRCQEGLEEKNERK